ncbi:MAG: hypothetical protein QM504_08165 [Pseudomonadota bacterium]
MVSNPPNGYAVIHDGNVTDKDIAWDAEGESWISLSDEMIDFTSDDVSDYFAVARLNNNLSN